MAFDNRDSIDFGKDNIPVLFRSIFIPTLLGMVFNVAFTTTDGIFVGNGVGSDGLAVINLVAPIMMVFTGLAVMLGVGSSVVAAIHLSKENVKAARINVTQAYVAAMVIATAVGLLLYLFARPVLKMLGVSAALTPMALEYYLWFIPTCFFLMFQIVGEFVIRLDGSPRYAMYANIIPAIINIVLDWVFIFPCGMGLKGAALATDIGAGVGMLLAAYYMFFKSNKLALYRLKASWVSLRLTLRNTGYMVKMGFSAFIGEFAISVMMMTGNLVVGYYLGDDGIAAYSVVCYLFPVVFMVCTAVAQSAQPIISFNHGAGSLHRVNHTFRHSLSISMVFGALIAVLFILFAGTIVSMFLHPGQQPYNLASQALPLYSLGFVFMAYNISVIGYFQSTEQAMIATVLMLMRGVVLMVVFFLLLPHLLGSLGLWLAVPCAEVVTALVAVLWKRFSFTRK